MGRGRFGGVRLGRLGAYPRKYTLINSSFGTPWDTGTPWDAVGRGGTRWDAVGRAGTPSWDALGHLGWDALGHARLGRLGTRRLGRLGTLTVGRVETSRWDAVGRAQFGTPWDTTGWDALGHILSVGRVETQKLYPQVGTPWDTTSRWDALGRHQHTKKIYIP